MVMRMKRTTSRKKQQQQQLNNDPPAGRIDLEGEFRYPQQQQQQAMQQQQQSIYPMVSASVRQPSPEEVALTSKNYRLAKELVRVCVCVLFCFKKIYSSHVLFVFCSFLKFFL